MSRPRFPRLSGDRLAQVTSARTSDDDHTPDEGHDQGVEQHDQPVEQPVEQHDDEQHDDGPPDHDETDDRSIDDTVDAVGAELGEARRRLAEVPASGVVANHAMGLFELAAIHLSSGPQHLVEAALAIDGMGALVEGLAGRLGENEEVLRDALQQIRLAFVQVKASATA